MTQDLRCQWHGPFTGERTACCIHHAELDRVKVEIPPTPWPGSAPNKANPVERPFAHGGLTPEARAPHDLSPAATRLAPLGRPHSKNPVTRLRAAIAPIAALDFESWNRLPKKERIIMLDVEQWEEIIAAYRDTAEASPIFTIEEVLQMFRNLGIDDECGTCMSIAFTNFGTGEHTCQKK